MSVSPNEIKRVKSQGFLLNRGTDNFSGRIITENGVLTAAQMRCLSEAAAKFGNGTLTFTSRLTVELPGIPFEKIDDYVEEWNNSEDTRTLREYLGLTAEEEDVWIDDSDEALMELLEKERRAQQ